MLWYAIKDLLEYHSVMVAEIRQPQLFTPKPFIQLEYMRMWRLAYFPCCAGRMFLFTF